MNREQKTKELIKELTIEKQSWDELQKLYNGQSNKEGERGLNFSKPSEDNNLWIFRADKIDKNDEYKPPKTALEKAFDEYGITVDKKKTEREKEIIREFQRKAALYINPEPDKNDILEWLSLMRHYEAPTRLLDWTYSFFIAVYFALAENLNGVVWALNAGALKLCKSKDITRKIRQTKHKERLEEFHKKLGEMDDVLESRSLGCKLYDLATICCFIKDNPITTVYAVNPFRLNPRLTIQQGLFLVPGDIRKSFWDNLTNVCEEEEKKTLKKHLFRIVINKDRNKERRNEIVRHLSSMNISNATLFPDLGGFAKSLGESMARPLIIDPCDNSETD
jgi:hypothetical protein